MDKDTSRALLPLVNDKETMERLQVYIEYRINKYRDLLEVQKDFDRITEMQGAMAELRRFKTLRDEVIKGAE
jgi:glutaredoxin-related protein